MTTKKLCLVTEVKSRIDSRLLTDETYFFSDTSFLLYVQKNTVPSFYLMSVWITILVNKGREGKETVEGRFRFIRSIPKSFNI